jgi:hypothetical protein
MNGKRILLELLLAASALTLPRFLERACPRPRPYTGSAAPAWEPLEGSGGIHPGEEESQGPLPEPESLARFFYRPPVQGRKEAAPPVVLPPEREKTGARPGEDRFYLIGTVRSAQGEERLYVKERETGRVIAVTPEAARESGDGAYLIQFENTLFKVRRN